MRISVLASFAILLALIASAHTLRAQPAATGQLTIELVGLRSTKGQVLAALFRKAEGFPSHPDKAFLRKQSNIKDKAALSIVFDGVPAGPFAVSLFHDENGNGVLETNAVGMPQEGWGASRDAKAGFGPPNFEAAQLTIAGGERKHIVIHLKY